MAVYRVREVIAPFLQSHVIHLPASGLVLAILCHQVEAGTVAESNSGRRLISVGHIGEDITVQVVIVGIPAVRTGLPRFLERLAGGIGVEEEEVHVVGDVGRGQDTDIVLDAQIAGKRPVQPDRGLPESAGVRIDMQTTVSYVRRIAFTPPARGQRTVRMIETLLEDHFLRRVILCQGRMAGWKTAPELQVVIPLADRSLPIPRHAVIILHRRPELQQQLALSKRGPAGEPEPSQSRQTRQRPIFGSHNQQRSVSAREMQSSADAA